MKKFGQYAKELEDIQLLREFVDNSKEYLIEFLNSDEDNVDAWLDRRFIRYKDDLKVEIRRSFKEYLEGLSNSITIEGK